MPVASPSGSSTNPSSNRRGAWEEPGNSASIVSWTLLSRPGGPATVSGRVRRETSWASRTKKGIPPKWSPCRCVTTMASIDEGSTPKRFMAMSEDAPQSMRKVVSSEHTWMQVWSLPPLPKVSPLPKNRTSMPLITVHSNRPVLGVPLPIKRPRSVIVGAREPHGHGEEACLLLAKVAKDHTDHEGFEIVSKRSWWKQMFSEVPLIRPTCPRRLAASRHRRSSPHPPSAYLQTGESEASRLRLSVRSDRLFMLGVPSMLLLLAPFVHSGRHLGICPVLNAPHIPL